LERSEELAAAMVDGWLDDPELGSVARQLAAGRVIEAVFPLAEATVEVELPADPESMSWADMQRLAARLALEESVATEIDGADDEAQRLVARPSESPNGE
jgi:hypothetical protein